MAFFVYFHENCGNGVRSRGSYGAVSVCFERGSLFLGAGNVIAFAVGLAFSAFRIAGAEGDCAGRFFGRFMRSFAAWDCRGAGQRFFARLGIYSVFAEGNDCDFLAYSDYRFVSYGFSGLLVDGDRAWPLVSGGLLGCKCLRYEEVLRL